MQASLSALWQACVRKRAGGWLTHGRAVIKVLILVPAAPATAPAALELAHAWPPSYLLRRQGSRVRGRGPGRRGRDLGCKCRSASSGGRRQRRQRVLRGGAAEPRAAQIPGRSAGFLKVSDQFSSIAKGSQQACMSPRHGLPPRPSFPPVVIRRAASLSVEGAAPLNAAIRCPMCSCGGLQLSAAGSTIWRIRMHACDSDDGCGDAK